MIQDVISRAANSLWPMIGLVILILGFAGVVFWTYRGRKDRFRHEASIPFDESPSHENPNGAKHG